MDFVPLKSSFKYSFFQQGFKKLLMAIKSLCAWENNRIEAFPETSLVDIIFYKIKTPNQDAHLSRGCFTLKPTGRVVVIVKQVLEVSISAVVKQQRLSKPLIMSVCEQCRVCGGKLHGVTCCME